MAVHWGGIAGMVFFYLLILAVGIWASRKTRGASNTERVMVGNRDFGWGVGLFTLIATWVGGGYINGTAEVVFTPGWGLVWAQAPWGYSLSFFVNGSFFAKQMRAAKYVTMLDPFQEKFGNRMGGIIFLSAITGELLWCAAILAALGSTISVILELDQNLSVILSACIAASYTLFGGLFSVAYTDVVQLACIFVGLWFCVPFALTHEAVTPLPQTLDRWVGEWDNRLMGVWIDNCFLLIFGGVPWQAYYQRILSARTPDLARNLSYAAAFGCLVLSIPAYLMGAVGASTDWSQTGINLNKTDPYETPGIVLPAVIQYLTPPVVAFLGLGAISAAVMSSTDSSVLAASSMFVRNIYKNIFRPSASEREMMWILRVAVIVVATIATVMALTVESIYVLFVLCSDFVYVVLFPQFVCVIHIKKSNTYGSAAAFALGLLLRLLGGEPALNLPAAIHYPFYDEELGQLFPYRTFCAIVSFVTLVAVSYATDIVFTRGYIPRRFDVFRCVVNKDQMAYVRPGQEVNSHEANGHEMHNFDAIDGKTT
ncbi:high-affinity choline transporter 1 [Strongylocentrotus purpuratus]|uniref:High-affinity choline transporter 1 n=1 Tax=Strongylocentrotus purpuratus TaxID=7668 RepID=A0A7M7REJ7_STRPU|nr:high-affinity choline transporter 1 [Strongylocentrotus purpuratus]